MRSDASRTYRAPRRAPTSLRLHQPTPLLLLLLLLLPHPLFLQLLEKALLLTAQCLLLQSQSILLLLENTSRNLVAGGTALCCCSLAAVTQYRLLLHRLSCRRSGNHRRPSRRGEVQRARLCQRLPRLLPYYLRLERKR